MWSIYSIESLILKGYYCPFHADHAKSELVILLVILSALCFVHISIIDVDSQRCIKILVILVSLLNPNTCATLHTNLDRSAVLLSILDLQSNNIACISWFSAKRRIIALLNHHCLVRTKSDIPPLFSIQTLFMSSGVIEDVSFTLVIIFFIFYFIYMSILYS